MSFAIHLATPSDDAPIRALLRREAMPGPIRLSYEREPGFGLGCGAAAEDCQTLVARDEQNGEIAGLACRSTRRVYLNGSEQRIGYLGQLRIDSRYRGRWLLSRGFAELKRMHDLDPVPVYLASIVAGNREAAGVLVHRPRRGFPRFRPIADYRTLAIGARRAKAPLRDCVQIAAPRADELAEVAQFLQLHGARRNLFPVWTVNEIERLAGFGLRGEDLRIARRSGKIAGVAALWDQSAYKQAVVRGYSGWLGRAAPFYNRLAPWLGRAPLPRPGEAIRCAYVSLIAVANDDAEVFRALLRELCNLASARGLSYMMVGLDCRDPLLPVASEYSHIAYPSTLYLAEWPPGEGLYERLDRRPVYVDIATL
jgi:hypothetical protein